MSRMKTCGVFCTARARLIDLLEQSDREGAVALNEKHAIRHKDSAARVFPKAPAVADARRSEQSVKPPSDLTVQTAGAGAIASGLAAAAAALAAAWAAIT